MKDKGLTLIEFLIACSLSCVLLILSSSFWNSLKQKNKQEILIDEIKNAVQFARVQAVIRGRSLTLSPVDSPSNWSNGVELRQINQHTHQEELINQWKWSHSQWAVDWIGATGAHTITISDNAMSAMSNGKFILTNTHTGAIKVLVLNRLGRIKEV